jgi:inorganic pyrophosphatase
LDRFLSASVVYPTDHGFVPETLAPDGDPLDVPVCVPEPTVPGSTVVANRIGLFKMADVQGPDHHVVCVPCHDADWNLLAGVADLPARLQAEAAHFFSVYKDVDPKALQGKRLRRSGCCHVNDQRAAIEISQAARR